ncbi:MAG: GrpB family protein [Henriciella sp.]|uniref:GrpB family protein n=1 Tax=Henriciella sp. TaxID=1968823 RepID=UPI003C7833A2
MDGIEIHPYDPDWPAAFQSEARQLSAALKGETVLDMVHFGSTAIPGMPAKPIIDILVLVPDLEGARSRYPARLDALGYDFWADNPKTDRLFFVKGMPPRGERRTHHVHVCEPQSEMHTRLAFIDYLTAHPEDAADYAALKQDLARRYGDDRKAYTRGKEAFVARIMSLAAAP